MQGLRTPDVKKVEYLEFPSDPRFRGAQRVVNIIVHSFGTGQFIVSSVSIFERVNAFYSIADVVVVQIVRAHIEVVSHFIERELCENVVATWQADLLRQIAIPQIQISPVSDAVTDNAGVEVAIFINYLEASKEEMQGLRTACAIAAIATETQNIEVKILISITLNSID